jgi:hypothetical protein
LHRCSNIGKYFDKGSTWSAIPEDNQVSHVWKGSVTKAWVYSMLHELGHLKIYNTRNYAQRNWKIVNDDINFDVVSATQYMREEIEAWDAGLKIADYIGVQIDREDYDKYASKYIMSYMRSLSSEYDLRKRGRKRKE